MPSRLSAASVKPSSTAVLTRPKTPKSPRLRSAKAPLRAEHASAFHIRTQGARPAISHWRCGPDGRASSGAGLQHHAAEPVAGEERELHIEPALAEGTAAKLLRLLDPVLGRIPMDEELVGRRGVAATGLEEHPRGLAK